MKVSSFSFVLRLGHFNFSHAYSKIGCLVMLFVSSIFITPATAQDLDPTVPPSGNFDLSFWKLTRPNNTERDEDALVNGYYKAGEFYTDTITGAMVFWCPNNGRTTSNTSFPRTELREMLRRGDTRISTQGINKNNWVFSSSTMENQEAAGGVDGIMTATVTVDHVSETSDEFRKVGRTIIGQIHASDDEPCRLYYRKLPGHERGSIYFAHEPTTSAEQWYDMIGSRSDNQPDPVDGIALGEEFSYEIRAMGNLLTVTIIREGKPDVVQEVDMTNSGFADDWMYFRAGNYNQNNAGDDDEFAQVSFYALDVRHFAATPPTEFQAPADIPRFQPFLSGAKLQAPTSSTIADIDRLNDSYTHPQYFYVINGDKMLFNQSGEDRRTELRHETNWNLNDENRSMHARIDIAEQTCEQVTVMQIHDDAGAGPGPNKPLLRVYKSTARNPENHLWAAVKTDDGGVATTHIDLGEDPGGFFNCDVRLVDGRMIIDFEGDERVNMDVSFWTFPSYWKAGAYLQDDGEATIHFDELFLEDGTTQNFFPSVRITSPENSENFLPGSDITITVDAADSDGQIAKIDLFEGGNGKLGELIDLPYTFTWTDVAEGAYTLTARAYDNEGASRTSLSTDITVRIPVDVSGVELCEVGALAVGATAQLAANVIPADANNQSMLFESDDPSVATITEDGFMTGLSEGTVTITVTTDEGGFVDLREVQILHPSTEFNWALQQPVVGSNPPDGSNDEDNLVDDDPDTRWSVEVFPQSAIVDLHGNVTITQTELTCFQDRAYQFVIEGAETIDGPYTMLVDRSKNTVQGLADLPIINRVDSLVARYVRITVMGADVYTGPWTSLTELRVFGEGERVYSSVDDIIENKILLSPNPATSTVTIDGAEDYDSVSVFDQQGRLVIQTSINGSGTLNVRDLEKGTYFVKLEGDERPVITRLIKL